MNMNNCEKYPILLVLDTKLSILNHAREAYGRIWQDMETAPTEMATIMMAVVAKEFANLENLYSKVSEEHSRVSLLGGKCCEIDFDVEDCAGCRLKHDNEGECDHPVFGEGGLYPDENLPLPLWQAKHSWLLGHITDIMKHTRMVAKTENRKITTDNSVKGHNS